MSSNTDTSTKSFSTSVTAFDGGIPFCIASPFTFDQIFRGSNGFIVVVEYYAQGISFANINSFNTAQARMQSNDFNATGALGCYPRIVYLVS